MSSEQAQLLTVKALTPQFSRAQSLRSSAATNEYFSDYASDRASLKSDDTKASYETPPSRTSSPIVQQPQIDSEMTLPVRPGAAKIAPLKLEKQNDPVYTGASLDELSPPTPEVDDTPYIRFAIEQLTRDEDVLGHGRHGSLTSNDAPSLRPVRAEDSTEDLPIVTTTQQANPPFEPRIQERPISRRPVPNETLLAIEAPDGQRWAELGFTPLPLRTMSLLTYLFLLALMIAGLILSNVYASRNHGLYEYDGYTTPRYFVFQYLPQLLGIILLVWLFVIEAAIYRVAPYFNMSTSQEHRNLLQDYRLYNANFVLPDLTWFRNGEIFLGIAFVIFWITSLTIPLLSCFYQTQYFTNIDTPGFRWTSVQAVGWTLLVLYLLLAMAIIYCLIRFQGWRSNLMWDPTSLADLIVLFQQSNAAHFFERTEVSARVGVQIPQRAMRLGYWTTSQKPLIFHGVGEENAPVNQLSVTSSPVTDEKTSDSSESGFDVERQRYSYASSFTRNIHAPNIRHRWVPWYLRDSAVLAWIIAAALLTIGFIIVSFVNNAVERGFQPLLPSFTSGDGFSDSNFLYSFLPSLLGMFLFLVWQPIDTFFRAVQPFANLTTPAGASAERSLLTSYNASLPLQVSLQALVNRDFKLAYISLVGLVSFTIPVLAGGVFTAQLFTSDNEVRMVASMPGYIALCVFVAIYALSFCIVWPTKKRYLPHKIDTIADLLSFLYASPLLSEPGLRGLRTQADLVGRLVGAPSGLTGDNRERKTTAQYGFGVYIGRDGKEHLGIDRLQRPGSGEMLITTGMRR